ncbi:MAG: phospholipase D-like domain-containing protein [Patescibacteria group bacterium]
MKLIKKNNTKISNKKLLPFLLSGLILILIILSAVVFFKYFFYKASNQKATPAKLIEVKDNFSGQLYFNNEFGKNIFSSVIIEAINQSKKSIELAVYSMDDTRIRDAVYRAEKRGVKVILIFSDKRKAGHNQIFKDLPLNIKRIDVPSVDGYMHHKFLIIDRGTAQEKLFFGSYNFTYLQEKYDPCFLLETSRPEIIAIFGQEFDRLVAGLYGRDKLDVNHDPLITRIQYPEGFLEIWFTPQESNGLRERMMELISGSKQGIKILIWNFTSKSLALDLVNAAKSTSVKIVTDDFNFSLPDSAFNFLLTEKKNNKLDNLEIITDARRNEEVSKLSGDKNLNSFMHHHLMLIDDQIAIFGTNNWSENGFYHSDESVMISNISSIVSPFVDTWQINYDKNK